MTYGVILGFVKENPSSINRRYIRNAVKEVSLKNNVLLKWCVVVWFFFNEMQVLLNVAVLL